MSRRHVVALRWLLFAPALLATTPIFGQQRATEFSWSSLLGLPSTELPRAVGQLATCSHERPQEFSLRADPARIKNKKFGDWHLPAGGGFILSDTFRSENVRVISCNIEQAASVQAMTFRGEIFSIQVTYNRCGQDRSGCQLKKLELDKLAFDSFSGKNYVVPAIGSGEISDREFESFLETENTLIAGTVSRSRLNSIVNCFVPSLNSQKWRCIFGAEIKDGYLRAATFVEVASGWGWNRQVDRYLMRQTFSDLRMEQSAIDAFVAEVNDRVDQIISHKQSTAEKQQQRQKLLETVR